MKVSPNESKEETRHAELIKHNQQHFDKESTNWDDPEYVRVSHETYATLIKHMKFISRDRTKVLNFGCGTGLLESQLRHDVKECVGIDISAGMIDRMQHKIDNEKWQNVKSFQLDILDESDASQRLLQNYEGLFDIMIVSCYTFHHLQNVNAIGKTLVKLLKPGGYFCIIDFATLKDKSKEFHSHLSEEAKASIGTHDGFSKDFLVEFYESELGLNNVQVEAACPLKHDGDEYPTTIAYGQKV